MTGEPILLCRVRSRTPTRRSAQLSSASSWRTEAGALLWWDDRRMTKRIIGRLKVSPDELVVLPWRGGAQVRVTQLRFESLRLLRPFLISVARNGTTITYGEASQAINENFFARGMGTLMDILSLDCQRRGEPSLAALVVRKDKGEVGYAFVGDPALTRQACYAFWSGGTAPASINARP